MEAATAENPGAPKYKIERLAPKTQRYCICVFVINEGVRIRNQLVAMSKFASLVDIIVADGGSTDSSLDLPFLATQNVSALLTKLGAGFLSSQMRMAFDFAMREGYEGVLVVDGNNKDDVSAIPQFVNKLKQGFDHIQGSRFIKGGRAIATPVIRLLALRFIHAPLIGWASGFKYSDTTNGFRAYSGRLLMDDRVQVFRDIFQRYELHYYLAIRASKLGFRVIEFPVTRRYPTRGKIPTKISPVRGYILVLSNLVCAVLGCFNPK